MSRAAIDPPAKLRSARKGGLDVWRRSKPPCCVCGSDKYHDWGYRPDASVICIGCFFKEMSASGPVAAGVAASGS